MDEEKLDRRAHWIQAIIVGIVGATVWCVKLEINNNQLTQDFKEYKKEMKQTIKEYDNRIDDLHDHVLTLEIERKNNGLH